MFIRKYPHAPSIGEVYYVAIARREGSQQSGSRPCVIFQNKAGNVHSPNVVVLPMTKKMKKVSLPVHVVIKGGNGLPYDSVVLCENPIVVPKANLGRCLTKLSEDDMGKIASASLLASSAVAFLNKDELIEIWHTAVELNG